ncbi:MAG TPA: hypothetical protein VMB26_17595 [Candidatus Binataceae bacterium]|nr:hypothetical protein [Candidatus Binataceae bacterium]
MAAATKQPTPYGSEVAAGVGAGVGGTITGGGQAVPTGSGVPIVTETGGLTTPGTITEASAVMPSVIPVYRPWVPSMMVGRRSSGLELVQLVEASLVMSMVVLSLSVATACNCSMQACGIEVAMNLGHGVGATVGLGTIVTVEVGAGVGGGGGPGQIEMDRIDGPGGPGVADELLPPPPQLKSIPNPMKTNSGITNSQPRPKFIRPL